MTITYIVDNSLYVNITNRCTNNCDFCIRNNGDGAYGSNSLWLEREPTVDEIYNDIMKYQLDKYDELIFCGYGEPTMRVYDLVEVAKKVKAASNIHIRINTNGHANLVHRTDVTPLFEGIIDTVSISLNNANKEDYNSICHPAYKNAYEKMIEFTALCSKHVENVVMSVVHGTIPDENLEKCRIIAENAGAKLRIREYIS
ncbi:MAG TPA: radical SAM protein [Clostridiales bacterium]|nr:radical SAM protein [Clostridiales bacterium]